MTHPAEARVAATSLAGRPGEPSFATFWAGEALSAYERACLASFATHRHRIVLYAYDPVSGVPDGVEVRDAAEVAPRDATSRFIFRGQANLSHFSDYFRYRLFERTPHVWVDADMLLVRRLDLPLGPKVLARERPDSICGAIMRLDPADPALARLLADTEAAMGRELIWGETGPLLLTKVYGREALLSGSHPPRRFFPIPHDDFWMVLLPEHRAHCEAACADAYGVHLWNNIVDRLGVWKELAPPEGSFLSDRFRELGSESFFRDAYPAHVMRQMVENWVLRKTGQDLGIRKLSAQILPSVRRTLRHYLGG